MPDNLRQYGTRNNADNVPKNAIYQVRDIATRNDTDNYKTSIQTYNYDPKSTSLSHPTTK